MNKNKADYGVFIYEWQIYKFCKTAPAKVLPLL